MAVEIGRGHGPAITLVLDIGMQDAERAAAIAFRQFDAAEQCRRMSKRATSVR